MYFLSRISQNKFTTILHNSLLTNHSLELLPISTISIKAHIELNIPICTRTLFLYIILVILLTFLLNILARLL
jgi:hypothetical protein